MVSDNAPTRTAYRTCPLCEASCGLEITLRRAPEGDERGGEVVQRIRGDRDDVFSKGYVLPELLTGLGTKHGFSASTVDQMPRHVASGYVFGSPVAIAVPDLDRTDHLVIIGANPCVSNSSVCTAPDFPGRIEAMRARGGKLVVIDPRLTRTGQEADEWLAVRPGSDALLLAAIANTLFAEGLADPGNHLAAHVAGLDDLRRALAGDSRWGADTAA